MRRHQVVAQAISLAAFLAASLGAAPLVAGPPATTWGELQQQLQNKSKSRKSSLLLQFAKDDHPALADRLKATRAARSAFVDDAGKRVETFLVEAHLQAVFGSRGKRTAALKNAAGAARKGVLEDKQRRIQEALAGEEAMDILAQVLARREAAPAGTLPGAVEKEAAVRVEGAQPAWLAIGDERQHGAARVLLARRAVLDNDGPGAVRLLSDVVDALGEGRDAAAVRAEAWRLLSRLFEAQAQWGDAVAAAIAADRAASTNPRQTAPITTSLASPYIRAKETAALCKRARDQQTSCARVELSRWGERTFYDFTAEKGGKAFDTERANDVLAEYDSLLQDCLKEGARANLTTNTHVELEWGVNNVGKALKSYDLRPMRLRGTLVDTCLQKAIGMFRYPPYKGEMQHVRLSFDVGDVQMK